MDIIITLTVFLDSAGFWSTGTTFHTFKWLLSFFWGALTVHFSALSHQTEALFVTAHGIKT